MQEEEKRERRDRISYFGIKGLSDRDLVRNILSPFEIPEAKEKVAVEGVLGILDKESTVRIENLTAIPEITHQAARIIVSAIEIGRRWPTRKERQIKTPDDAYAEIRHYATRPQENLIVMALNGAHEIIFTEVVSIGTVNMTYAHPREIFSNAVRSRATGIILAHNHPSGVLKASAEDVTLTKRVISCGQLLGITVLDHLIISEAGYISLKAKGFVP